MARFPKHLEGYTDVSGGFVYCVDVLPERKAHLFKWVGSGFFMVTDKDIEEHTDIAWEDFHKRDRKDPDLLKPIPSMQASHSFLLHSNRQLGPDAFVETAFRVVHEMRRVAYEWTTETITFCASYGGTTRYFRTIYGATKLANDDFAKALVDTLSQLSVEARMIGHPPTFLWVTLHSGLEYSDMYKYNSLPQPQEKTRFDRAPLV